MAKSTKASLSARIPSDLMDEVKAYCKRHQLTQADLVTTAVHTYLQSPSQPPTPAQPAPDPAWEQWQASVEARLAALEALWATEEDEEDEEDPEEASLGPASRSRPPEPEGKAAELPAKAIQSIAAAVETFQRQTTDLRPEPEIVEIEVDPVLVDEDLDPVVLSTDEAYHLARERGFVGAGDRAFLRRWERYAEKGIDRFHTEWGLERLPNSDQWVDLWDGEAQAS